MTAMPRGSKRSERVEAQNRVIFAGIGFALLSQYSFLLPFYYAGPVFSLMAMVCAVTVIVWKVAERLWLT